MIQNQSVGFCSHKIHKGTGNSRNLFSYWVDDIPLQFERKALNIKNSKFRFLTFKSKRVA